MSELWQKLCGAFSMRVRVQRDSHDGAKREKMAVNDLKRSRVTWTSTKGKGITSVATDVDIEQW
jgi:hypothetical protein